MKLDYRKKIYSKLKKAGKKPLTFKELLRSCRGKGFEFEKFTKAVDKMKKNGEIMENKFGIRLVDPKKFVKCEVVRLNKTYGFVKNLDTDEEIFVVGKYLKGAMPHDIVLVRTFKGEGACTEGEVMSIVEENFAKFTGELVSEFGVLKIVPDMLSKYAMTFENGLNAHDTDLKVTGCYTGFTGSTEISVGEDGRSTFLNPNGIYVKKSIFDDKLYVYIADTDNSRAVKCTVESGTEMTLVQEYTKPDTKLYDSETFNPSKILADKAENIYVVCKSVNTGSVQFNKDGEFQGFYGANRVEVTAAVIAQKLWRKIASNEQISAMTRNVPVEYANFDIDADGFIYTVTEAANTTTDAVKKLNPAGYNIWDNAVGDEYSFGDVASEYDSTTNKTYKCRLTDICVSDNGTINVLDYENGRVFQYDKLCNLLCIFGTKNSTSDQAGSFLGPNAIEARGNEVYILDGTKNDITVYTETTFGNVVHRAVLLYDEGRYSDARADWEEVIKRDGGYAMAYVGLGKACLNDGEYMKALDYFKTAYDQDDYDKAFKYAREEWLRDNFTVIMIVIIVLIALLIVKAVLKKKGIKLIKRKKKEGN